MVLPQASTHKKKKYRDIRFYRAIAQAYDKVNTANR